MSRWLDLAGPAGLSWSLGNLQLVVLALLLTGLGLTLWRVTQRLAGQPLRLALICLANTLAFAAIALLIAPPERSGPGSGRAVLLTDGASLDDLPIGVPVFALPDWRSPEETTTRVTRLSLPGQLALRQPGLAQLELRGHGLDSEALAQLPAALRIDFEPPVLEGFTEMAWPRLLEAGSPLQLGGRLLLGAEDRVARLRLVDPAGLNVAETSVRSGQRFRLTTLPRAPGPATYRLQAWRGDQLVAEEPVTIQVRPNAGVRLLILQSAPSFDTRQFINWAADQGASALVLTQISRDRSLVQAFNSPAPGRDSLTPELLAESDLLLLDGQRWASLTPAEQMMIFNEIDRGLGLLLLADSALADWLRRDDGALQRTLQFRLQDKGVSATEPLAWPLWPGAEPSLPLPVAHLRLEGNTLRTLTRSEEGELLDAWYPEGEGRIAVSLLRERHRWFTAGDPAASHYWSRLLYTLARPLERARWVAPDPVEMVQRGQSTPVCAESREPRSFRLQPPKNETARRGTLVPHADGFPVACGWWVPEAAGWHRIQLMDRESGELQDTLQLHVYGAEAWLAHRRAQRHAATGERARAVGVKASRSASPSTASTGASLEASLGAKKQAVNPLWAYLLLLFSVTALWLERRFYDLGRSTVGRGPLID